MDLNERAGLRRAPAPTTLERVAAFLAFAQEARRRAEEMADRARLLRDRSRSARDDARHAQQRITGQR